jgi:DNA-binding GntR family transcriptional regulator
MKAPKPFSLESPEKHRQSDLAYTRIRGEIIRCQLAPGAEVSETGLAKRLAFGKAAVRAALMRLCQEGLVLVIPRRGYVITPITVKDILEVFELRRIVEPAIARLSVGKVDRTVLVEADTRWSEGYAASGTYVEDSALQANKDFHLAIAQATGNARLVQMQARILDETDRLIYLGLPIAGERSEIQEGHKSLIEALARGDPVGTELAAIRHVEVAKAIVVDAVMSSSTIMHTAIAVQRHKTGTHQ